MIIIEGPDGSGKSTLAQQLAASLNLPVHHSGGPAKSPEEILERQRRMNQRLYQGDVLIFDRAPCVSDPIYGPLLRGWTAFENRLDLALEMRYLLRVPIIYCRPPRRIIAVSYEARGEERKAHKPAEHAQGVARNLQSLIDLYDIAIGDFPHWRYDWTRQHDGPSFPDLVNLIRSRLEIKELIT